MRTLLAITLSALMALAACAPPSGGGTAPTPSGQITIKMSEYKFEPSSIQLKAGQQVKITIENVGEKDHELMIGRKVKQEGGHPAGYEENFFKGIEVKAEREGKAIDPMSLVEEEEHDAGFMVVLHKGDKPVTISFTVPADKVGEWEMGCFEDDGQHYNEGMKGKLTVTQ